MQKATFHSALAFIVFSSLTALSPRANSKEQSTVRIALANLPHFPDPRLSSESSAQELDDLIHCSLLNFDERAQIVPQAASALPVWSDQTTLEIQVREGLKFSDGTSLSASDVMASFQYRIENPGLITDEKSRNLLRVELRGVQGLRFKLKTPDASFPLLLTSGILSQKHRQTKAFDPLQVPTCGPFKVAKISQNSIHLQRNFHYGIGAPARLETLEFRKIKDEATRLTLLKRGEVDLDQTGLSRPAILGLEKSFPRLKILRQVGLQTTYLGFDLRDSIVRQLPVRRAIALALNRQAIMDYILNGMAIQARTLLPPFSPFFQTEMQQETQNTREANLVLEQNGFPMKNGVRMTLNFRTTPDITHVGVAKAIASQLQKIGIRIVVETLEGGALMKSLETAEGQLWSFTSADVKDPDYYRSMYSSEMVPPLGTNFSRLANTRLDQLLNAGRKETSNPERSKIYAEVQTIIHKEIPHIYLWHEEKYAVVHHRLKEFRPYADGRYFPLSQAFVE